MRLCTTSQRQKCYRLFKLEHLIGRCKRPIVEDVDPERAAARLERGVLTIALPVVEKAPPAGRYRITVERLD